MNPKCPACGGELERVTYPGGALNREQWDSVKAGDFVCRTCPDNGRAAGGDGAYYWESEVTKPAVKPHTYPIEIFCNGELAFKLDSEDAEGDMNAIKALMRIRTARRENKPLTDLELYGRENPHDVIHTSASGKVTVVRDGKPVESACTFKKGDKDPCPTCPRLITTLHSCGLLQDVLHEAHPNSDAKPAVPMFVLEQRFKPGWYFEWWGDENGGPYWTTDLAKAEKLTEERAKYEKGMVREETLIIPYEQAATSSCPPPPKG